MKTQNNTQTQPIKKVTLSKETIRILTSNEVSRDPATLTRIC